MDTARWSPSPRHGMGEEAVAVDTFLAAASVAMEATLVASCRRQVRPETAVGALARTVHWRSATVFRRPTFCEGHMGNTETRKCSRSCDPL
jgi:hypothetical protein